MEGTLRVINDLEREGIIERYALGGATALLFYTEPALTFDVDVFVFLPGAHDRKQLVSLAPLYQALEVRGCRADKEHVLIQGIPVQFIPVYNALVEEAVRKAKTKDYAGVKTKVLSLEHLLAIMLDTNRPKDRERLRHLVNEIRFDKKILAGILDRHGLDKRWRKEVRRE